MTYSGIPALEQIKNYRGEVNYNEEDDQHFPTLTVEQTLDFSLLNKTRKHEKRGHSSNHQCALEDVRHLPYQIHSCWRCRSSFILNIFSR